MRAFRRLTATGAYLARADLDTDTIIRVERLASHPRGELGRWAFEPLRYRADGSENPDFVLNRAAHRGAAILVAGANFGCGSSRETAVWALEDHGLRAIVAPSFGPIFFENCFQNGIPAIVLPADDVAALGAAIERDPPMTIDVEALTITAGGRTWRFALDPLRRRLLLEGRDEIELVLADGDAIAAFEARDRLARPWLYR